MNTNNAVYCDFLGFWLAVLGCLGMVIWAELLAKLFIIYNDMSKLWETE